MIALVLQVARVRETSTCRFFVALVGVFLFYISLISCLLEIGWLLFVVSAVSSVCGWLLMIIFFCYCMFFNSVRVIVIGLV